jgi:hypothetical protein
MVSNRKENIMQGITLPDGTVLNKIATAAAIASVWRQDAPNTADASRLQTAAMLFANSTQDEVKGILKGADRKAGTKAPLVEALIADAGMEDSSARNRLSEHKALWQAYLTGRFSFFDPQTGALVGVKGWFDAVGQARKVLTAVKEAEAKEAEATARRDLVKVLSAAQPDAEANVLLEQAARVIAADAAEAETESKVRRAVKAAEAAGGYFMPAGSMQAMAEWLVAHVGNPAALVDCLIDRINQITDVQARDEADAQARQAHEKEAIAAARVERLAAEHS